MILLLQLRFLYVNFGAISRKTDLLSMTAQVKFEPKKILLHICDTYNCGYLPYTVFRFYLINVQTNADSPSDFAVLCLFFVFCFVLIFVFVFVFVFDFFFRTSPSVAKSRYLKNMKNMLLKRAKARRLFSQNYMLKSFTVL